MTIEIIKQTDWKDVKKAACSTINKKFTSSKIDDSWKKQILLAEHSPIRVLKYSINITNIKYWVAMHLVRHKIGVEFFISTQREDRTGINRNDKKQSDLISMRIDLNAQAFINISRKRLCNKAHIETINVWNAVLSELEKIDPVLYSVCVPECVYRGFCPEFHCCGFSKTHSFINFVYDYRKRVFE